MKVYAEAQGNLEASDNNQENLINYKLLTFLEIPNILLSFWETRLASITMHDQSLIHGDKTCV